MSSMQTFCLSLARRSPLVSYREWRSVSSRSTSKAEPVVWKLDRLGRNLAHLVNTVQDLSARGVGLRVLAGDRTQIDTTTAAGRLVFGIFGAGRVRAGADPDGLLDALERHGCGGRGRPSRRPRAVRAGRSRRRKRATSPSPWLVRTLTRITLPSGKPAKP